MRRRPAATEQPSNNQLATHMMRESSGAHRPPKRKTKATLWLSATCRRLHKQTWPKASTQP